MAAHRGGAFLELTAKKPQIEIMRPRNSRPHYPVNQLNTVFYGVFLQSASQAEGRGFETRLPLQRGAGHLQPRLPIPGCPTGLRPHGH